MTTQQTKVESARRIIAETYGRTRDERGTLMVGDGPARVEAIVRGDADGYWEMRAVMAALSDAQPEAPTPSPELTARMVAFVRMGQKLPGMTFPEGHPIGVFFAEMDAIAAELEPVDPDLIEARTLAVQLAHAQEAGQTGGAISSIRNGEFDEAPLWGIPVLREAIKRGRALAEAGK